MDSDDFPKTLFDESPLYLTPPHSASVYPTLQTNFYEPEPFEPKEPCKSRSKSKTSGIFGVCSVEGATAGYQTSRSTISFVHSKTTLACPSVINLERPISTNLAFSNELAWNLKGLQFYA